MAPRPGDSSQLQTGAVIHLNPELDPRPAAQQIGRSQIPVERRGDRLDSPVHHSVAVAMFEIVPVVQSDSQPPERFERPDALAVHHADPCVHLIQQRFMKRGIAQRLVDNRQAQIRW